MDKILDNAKKHGYVEGGLFSKSRLSGNADNLVKNYTRAELNEMLLHNDINRTMKDAIQNALSHKNASAVNDAEILRRRASDTVLNNVRNSLEINNTDLGLAWYDFATLSLNVIRDNPQTCVIAGQFLNGKFEPKIFDKNKGNILDWGDAKSSRKYTEEFFKLFINHILNSNINTSDIKKWIEHKS